MAVIQSVRGEDLQVDSARLALVAFHEGLIDSSHLRYATRTWLESQDRELMDVLIEEGIIAAGQDELLVEKLIQYHPAHSVPGALGFMPHGQESDPGFEQTDDIAESASDLGKRSSSSNKRTGRSRSSESRRHDYYDSIHEQFTRDDRVLSRLSQQISGFRRRLYQDVRRFVRSCASLGDIFTQWLRFNYKYAIGGLLGIAVLIPASLYTAHLINPNKKPTAFGGQPPNESQPSDELQLVDAGDGLRDSDPQADGADDARGAESMLALGQESTAPSIESASRLGDEPVGEATALDMAFRSSAELTGEAAESHLDAVSGEVELSAEQPADLVLSSESPSQDVVGPSDELPEPSEAESEVVLASSTPDIARAPVRALSERRSMRGTANPDKYLVAGGKLIAAKQFGRASILLASAQAEFPESIELFQMLATAYLASSDYMAAGALLTDNRFADPENDVWLMLFTSWLLHAPEDARNDAATQLQRLVVTRASEDPLRRAEAWIAARSKHTQRANEILAPKPLFGDRTFADALFYSVCLRNQERYPEAREQMEYAIGAYMELVKTLQFSSSDHSSNALASRLARTTIERAVNRYAASMPK